MNQVCEITMATNDVVTIWWCHHNNWWCHAHILYSFGVILEKCLFLTKNSLFKIYFEKYQNFNATITFHLLGQYSFILVYIFSQHNLNEG